MVRFIGVVGDLADSTQGGREIRPLLQMIRFMSLVDLRGRVLRWSDFIRETSLWGGKIKAIDITNDFIIIGAPIFINIFISIIFSQTLLYLLYLIFIPKCQIDTYGLLVVLITSRS